MNRLKSKLRYFTLVWQAKATNESEQADFVNFDPKIGCHMATSLEQSEKGGQISNLQSDIYDENLVKIGPVDPEITG